MEGCFRRSEERTQPLLVASIASLPNHPFTPLVFLSLSLSLFVSPRLEFALTDWLWLAGRSSVCQFKVVAFITREYNGWRGSLEWQTSFITSKCRYKLFFKRIEQKYIKMYCHIITLEKRWNYFYKITKFITTFIYWSKMLVSDIANESTKSLCDFLRTRKTQGGNCCFAPVSVQPSD